MSKITKQPQICNQDLTLENVPNFNDDWLVIGRFALSFDGFDFWKSFNKCADVADKCYSDFFNKKNVTLTELRTFLFFEQRRWNHFGDEPNEEAINYIRSLVEKIRKKVSCKELE